MRTYRRALLALAAAAIIVGALRWPAPPTPARAEARCFTETGACLSGPIRDFWETHGGLAVFGFPLAPETSAAGVTQQRFERTRIELHPENAAPHDVLLARVGAEALARQGRDWQQLPKARPDAPQYFAETGQAIAPEFIGYWQNHGLEQDGEPGFSAAESTALFGLPLTPATAERSASDGRPRLTQYFERARFELHPENSPDTQVQLGLLEAEATPPAAPAPPAVSAAGPPGPLRVSGPNLTLGGQIVRLKGVNYYPQGRPWNEMWTSWDANQTARELRQARDQLGINAVRVLVPSNEEFGKRTLRRLRQLSQIASDLNLKLIVTLFDFDDAFPAAGTPEEARKIEALKTLVAAFRNDDRIAAWDLHNEPDLYGTWTGGNASAVLDWLGRTADLLHQIDTDHLVTVNMSLPENLLARGPDGRRPVDYADFVSVHSYNAPDMVRQLGVIRAQTAKPIVLGEFGWPTGPRCVVRGYTEAEQLAVYRTALAAADTAGAAGVIAWQLRDTDSGPTRRSDTREEHYGLYRPDGSRKPAAEPFTAFAAAPLPSTYQTKERLTNDGVDVPDGPQKPLLVKTSGFYVKGWFRRAYELFGKQTSLGTPLGEAFVRPEDQRIVQYFTRAVLELHLEAGEDPAFDALREPEKVALLVRPLALGADLAAGRQFAPSGAPSGLTFPNLPFSVSGPFATFYTTFNGGWRLGLPLSDQLTETVDSVPLTVQYFERGRLQLNPATGQAEPSTLGTAAFGQRCTALGQ